MNNFILHYFLIGIFLTATAAYNLHFLELPENKALTSNEVDIKPLENKNSMYSGTFSDDGYGKDIFDFVRTLDSLIERTANEIRSNIKSENNVNNGWNSLYDTDESYNDGKFRPRRHLEDDTMDLMFHFPTTPKKDDKNKLENFPSVGFEEQNNISDNEVKLVPNIYDRFNTNRFGWQVNVSAGSTSNATIRSNTTEDVKLQNTGVTENSTKNVQANETFNGMVVNGLNTITNTEKKPVFSKDEFEALVKDKEIERQHPREGLAANLRLSRSRKEIIEKRFRPIHARLVSDVKPNDFEIDKEEMVSFTMIIIGSMVFMSFLAAGLVAYMKMGQQGLANMFINPK